MPITFYRIMISYQIYFIECHCIQDNFYLSFGGWTSLGGWSNFKDEWPLTSWFHLFFQRPHNFFEHLKNNSSSCLLQHMKKLGRCFSLISYTIVHLKLVSFIYFMKNNFFVISLKIFQIYSQCLNSHEWS